MIDDGQLCRTPTEDFSGCYFGTAICAPRFARNESPSPYADLVCVPFDNTDDPDGRGFRVSLPLCAP